MRTSPAAAPYFIMAHHRSGSNFLNDLLQAHPRLECVNEPFSMHTAFFRRCDLEPWRREEFDPVMLHPELAPHPTLRNYLLELRAYLSHSSGTRVIGFKDTVLFEKLEWLKAFIPSLKIVFLKRDPRAIVSSVLRSNLVGLWDYARLVPPAFAKIKPDYVSRIDSTDASVAAAEIVAMSIATRYAHARRALEGFEHLQIHLDELTHEPAMQLERLSAFLGVPPHQGPLSFLAQRQAVSRGGAFSSFRSHDDVRNTWSRHLSPAQVRAVETVMDCP